MQLCMEPEAARCLPHLWSFPFSFVWPTTLTLKCHSCIRVWYSVIKDVDVTEKKKCFYNIFLNAKRMPLGRNILFGRGKMVWGGGILNSLASLKKLYLGVRYVSHCCFIIWGWMDGSLKKKRVLSWQNRLFLLWNTVFKWHGLVFLWPGEKQNAIFLFFLWQPIQIPDLIPNGCYLGIENADVAPFRQSILLSQSYFY